MEEEKDDNVLQNSMERKLDCCGSPKQSPKMKQKKKTKSSETLGSESPKKRKESIFTKLGHKLLQTSHKKALANSDDSVSRSMESLDKLLEERIDSSNGARSASEASIFTGKKVVFEIDIEDAESDERVKPSSREGSPLVEQTTGKKKHKLHRQTSEISVQSDRGQTEPTRGRSQSGDVIPVLSEDSNFLVFECDKENLNQVVLLCAQARHSS